MSIYTFKQHIANFFGWRSHRKIIVFESDDWGSIRMPSIASYVKLRKFGVNLEDDDSKRYNLYDSLATSNDLELLFEVLSGVKDIYSNNAVFTPMSIVANPDFRRIKDSGFSDYFYEPFTETLKNNRGCEKSFDLWKEGIKNNLFLPQMHGREHLNIRAWMKALQNGEEQTRLAFDEGLWGFVPDQKKLPRIDYQAAFSLEDISELDNHRNIIIDGIILFKRIFGYQATYFVPPNGPFHNSLNKTLIENGIKYRAASKIQQEPMGGGKTKVRFHYLGQKDKHGITYITRNCFFEPSLPGKDWVDSCLSDINIAFYWNRPATISTHRVNYIGALRPKNRREGLRQLKILLNEILKKWPDVAFMTTAQLGALIKGEQFTEATKTKSFRMSSYKD